MKVKAILTPKSLPLTETRGNFFLPSPENSSLDMQGWLGCHTEERESSSYPALLFRIPGEADLTGRRDQKTYGVMSSGSVIQKTVDAALLLQSAGKEQPHLPKPVANGTRGGIGVLGASSKLSSARVLVNGSFSDQTARTTADRKALP